MTDPVTTPEIPMEGTPASEAPVTPEQEVNPEEEIISTIIQMIAQLGAESQRQLMGFLNDQFSGLMREEEEEIKNTPEEQARKAEVISEAF